MLSDRSCRPPRFKRGMYEGKIAPKTFPDRQVLTFTLWKRRLPWCFNSNVALNVKTLQFGHSLRQNFDSRHSWATLVTWSFGISNTCQKFSKYFPCAVITSQAHTFQSYAILVISWHLTSRIGSHHFQKTQPIETLEKFKKWDNIGLSLQKDLSCTKSWQKFMLLL